MNLKRVQHALGLAETRNFARAAEKLNLSQPALSRSIQLLEQELGLRLFDRDKRNVHVTAVGALFLARAARLAEEAQQLQRDMALTREGRLGRLAFGAGPYPMAALLPQLLSALRSSHPALEVQLLQDHSEQLLQRLLDERIEFFIAERRDLAPDPSLAIEPLTQLPAAFWVRPGHPLLARIGGAAPKPRELLAHGLATVSLTPHLLGLLARGLRLQPGEILPVLLRADHLELLLEQTRGSDLVLLAPYAAVAPGRLQALSWPSLPAVYADIAVIHRQGRSLSPAARLAIERLRELAPRRSPALTPPPTH